MKITGIKNPLKGCTSWSGTASDGDKHYHWFYEPRSWFLMQEQDEINRRCWMNVDPPTGAKRAVLKAIREARS